MAGDSKTLADNGQMASNVITSDTLPADFPTELEAVVVNMDKVLFEGKIASAVVPVSAGNLAILPGHTPMFTKLDKGKIVVNPSNGSPVEIEIEGGIAKITQVKAVILIGF